jgi:hypothetical protein
MTDEKQKIHENEVEDNNNHGGKRERAGRPVGSKSKKPWKGMLELAEKHNTSPLDYMLGVLNNPMSSPDKKLYAAEKAAPYIHPRLASSTSRIGSDEPIEIKVEWQKD